MSPGARLQLGRAVTRLRPDILASRVMLAEIAHIDDRLTTRQAFELEFVRVAIDE